MGTTYRLNTRSKPGLLTAMLHALVGGGGRVSFEGRLAESDLVKLAGASCEENGALKRGTISPKLDFVVLPLIAETLPLIEKAIDSKIGFKGYQGIIHVQIEKNGALVFGAYDNFHADSVFVESTDISEVLLEQLVKDKVLHSFERRAPS